MHRKGPRLIRIARLWLRRLAIRIDRRAPAWVREVAPWGTSLTLHGLALLGLALVVLVRSGADEGASVLDTTLSGQLTDDLTSLAPGERSGDPFTRLDSQDPPSLSLVPGMEDPEANNVPELPPGMQLGPRLQLHASRAMADVADVPEGVAQALRDGGPRSAPFAGRQAASRARLVRREGGTVESEAAVERGLDWLARHQRPDGSWALDIGPQCSGSGCPPTKALDSDTAATGLALLPMLGAGLTHQDPGRYQGHVRRGLDALIRSQAADGNLFTGGSGNAHMYSHAIAAMALCEAYGLTGDPELREPAGKALAYIIKAQGPDGGWRYRPGAPGDTSVYGWQIFALRSAALAGLKVPKPTLSGCRTYLDRAAADERKTTYAYMPGGAATPVMTAEALLARQLLGWPRSHPALRLGTAQVVGHLDGPGSRERNIYYWYYATQLLHNMDGPAWRTWNRLVRDGLVASQVAGEGCDRGSWDPLNPSPDRWGEKAGRLYQTALSLLTLEVYYRYLPLYRDAKGAPADAD